MSKHAREDARKRIVNWKVEVYCKLFCEARNEKTNGIFHIATL